MCEHTAHTSSATQTARTYGANTYTNGARQTARSANIRRKQTAGTTCVQAIRAFADSNWAVTRSTTRYTIMLAGAGIGSVSRRQHCISMSSCEAELNALAECAIELIHVSAMLTHIGHRQESAIECFTDNKAAYDLCHRFTSAQNSRHIDRKMFKMRELRGAGAVNVKLIPTDDNEADLYTKILKRVTFEKFRKAVLNLPGDTGLEHARKVNMVNSRAGKKPG